MKTLRVFIDTPYDESPDVSWLSQTPAQLGSLAAAVANKRRLLAYENGDWFCIGVRLKAEITLDSGALVILTSPGVWGVESDASEEYIKSTALEADTLDIIRDLTQLGCSAKEIADALAEVALSGL